jgi:putative transposase
LNALLLAIQQVSEVENDEIEKLWVDRDVNAAINLKRLGLDVFPSIKCRKGGVVIVNSITNTTSKEVLRILRNA